MHDFVERNVAGRHALWIELNLELAQIATENFHCCDTRNSEQTITDIELCKVTETHQVGGTGVGLKGELEYFIQSPSQAGDQWRFGARGQLGSNLSYPLCHELTRAGSPLPATPPACQTRSVCWPCPCV